MRPLTRPLLLFFSLVSLGGAGPGCNFEVDKGGGDASVEASETRTEDAPVAKAETTASFEWIKANIVVPKCARCHRSFTTYEGLMAVVTPGAPQDSPLYIETESGNMPRRAPRLDPEKLEAIYNWIKNGAPET